MARESASLFCGRLSDLEDRRHRNLPFGDFFLLYRTNTYIAPSEQEHGLGAGHRNRPHRAGQASYSYSLMCSIFRLLASGAASP